MKIAHLRGLALGVAGLAGVLAWSQLPPPEPLKTIKVADGLHILEGAGGNVAVLATSEGTLLIDDKFAPNVPQILEAAKALNNQPVRYILNTHHHGDHTGGNAEIGAKEPVEIIAHENARTNMIRGKQPGVPRLAYQSAVSVNLGGMEVRAIHLGRGHTNGDAVILIPKLRVLHSGDLFSVPGPMIDYANGGSGIEWIRTLDRILELDFETVIPGHGPVSKRSDVVEFRAKVAKMVSDMKALRSKGLSKEDAVKAYDVKATGWEPTRLVGRVLPGLYDEVGK